MKGGSAAQDNGASGDSATLDRGGGGIVEAAMAVVAFATNSILCLASFWVLQRASHCLAMLQVMS